MKAKAKVNSGRLGKGQLAEAVLEAMQPRVDYGPSGLAKELGRSAGAVANILTKAAEAGTVVQTGDSPRRYRLNGRRRR